MPRNCELGLFYELSPRSSRATVDDILLDRTWLFSFVLLWFCIVCLVLQFMHYLPRCTLYSDILLWFAYLIFTFAANMCYYSYLHTCQVMVRNTAKLGDVGCTLPSKEELAMAGVAPQCLGESYVDDINLTSLLALSVRNIWGYLLYFILFQSYCPRWPIPFGL